MNNNYWQPFESGQVYHIYNRAVSERNLFEQKEDYLRFLKKYDLFFNTCFDTLAYCLMPNHFHFLVSVKPVSEIRNNIQIPDSNILELFIKEEASEDEMILDYKRRLYSSHALYLNKRTNIRGPLFEKRFKRVSIDIDRKLKYLIYYIHHNPIHHGFVNHYSSWKYSSYHDYLTETASLISKELVKKEFKDPSSFKNGHAEFKVDYNEQHNLD